MEILVLGAIENLQNPPREISPPQKRNICFNDPSFLHFQKILKFYKSKGNDYIIFFLLIVSSNLRNASTYQDFKGRRTIQRSTRNQTETNRLERAKCPVCERVLNFPALTLFRRETTKTISGRQKEAFLLLLLDICNGTRSKNR